MMAQQQLLMIILSVILVGIAISVGVSMFNSYAVMSNQDAMVLDVINLSMSAYQYVLKPQMMAGGSGSFKGYEIPQGMENNANGSYEIIVSEDGKTISLIGYSYLYEGATIAAIYNTNLEIIPYIPEETQGALASFSNSFNRGGFLFTDW